MAVGPQRRRHSLRLVGFDYREPRPYYVTICAQNRECIYGEVLDGVMCRNDAGDMIASSWLNLETEFSTLHLDEWVVMPNHLHGIVSFAGDTRQASAGDPSLPRIMQSFKSRTTNAYIRGVKTKDWPAFNRRIWQRSYHDRIIRDDQELRRIREYIANNPLKWHLDSENPQAPKRGGGRR